MEYFIEPGVIKNGHSDHKDKTDYFKMGYKKLLEANKKNESILFKAIVRIDNKIEIVQPNTFGFAMLAAEVSGVWSILKFTLFLLTYLFAHTLFM